MAPKAAKQAAPPPPVGFTGEVPCPSLGQKVSDKIRARRAARKAQQPRRRATRVPHQQGIFNAGGRPTARKARRRPPRRGMLFAVFSVVVAATVLTAAAVEFASWSAATEMFFVAEGISAGTAWFFGDPNPPAKPPKAPRKPRAAGNPPKGSGGHLCGVLTQGGKGMPCQRPVAKAGNFCFDHPGGRLSTKPAGTSSPKPTGPKQTKKAAPHSLGNTGA